MAGYNYHEWYDFTEIAERIRRLDNMTQGLSGVHATQSPCINYENFGGPYSTDWGVSNFESAQYVGNFNRQYNYPISNFYNRGWQNNSNFYWQQEYEQVPQWGAEHYVSNYQVQIQPHHQPQEEERPSIEDSLMQFKVQLETHFKDIEVAGKDMDVSIKDMDVSIRNIQVQLDQIRRVLEIESQESLLNDAENNPVHESTDDYDDVETVMEDEVNDEVEKSVKLEDSVKPTQNTETTIMPIGVGNESDVHDFVEYMKEIVTKSRPQQENKKESKFQPDERGKYHKKKDKNWADRKILDDHLRLCRRGLLFKAQKRLRRNTFNTRWRSFITKSSQRLKLRRLMGGNPPW